MQRRPAATIVQTVALAIGLMALLLLSVTRGDLVAAWRKSVPPNAPDHFVINVQPDQRAAFVVALRGSGVASFDLAPMVRGRLVDIDGKPVRSSDYEGDQAKRLVEREFNLSYMTALPEHNTVVAGRWFAPDATDEVSIEEGIAKTMRVKLGDRVKFDIAGVPAEGRVTSIRKLDWDSMHVNFFVVFPPKVLEKASQTWISAFHLGQADVATSSRLAQRFPNVTIVDTGAILRQVQAIVDQVVRAVEFLFVFTLAAGVLVLYAALLSSRDERVREAALLRALGASRRQLTRAQLAEFTGIGVVAGLLAAGGASLVGWVLATRAFDFPYSFGIASWLLGVAGGSVLAWAGGWFGLRSVINEPPLRTLREG